MKEFNYNPEQSGTREWQWLHHKANWLETRIATLEGSLDRNAWKIDFESGTPREGYLKGARKRLAGEIADARRSLQETLKRIEWIK